MSKPDLCELSGEQLEKIGGTVCIVVAIVGAMLLGLFLGWIVCN